MKWTDGGFLKDVRNEGGRGRKDGRKKVKERKKRGNSKVLRYMMGLQKFPHFYIYNLV